ncbi:MAG: 50S ribosomal protein L6 [Nanoarchaeota archaeon]|jgi:large subunit ribosomal protein L6
MTTKKGIEQRLEIPDGITVRVDLGVVILSSLKGELRRNMHNKRIKIIVENKNLSFITERDTKNLRKLIGTYKAHINNMFRGLKDGHKYILKICSGHFPMNVSVSKNDFIVKNLLGEKIPRVLRFDNKVSVNVDGEIVTVESIDKELAGQTSASIEQLTKRAGYDTRVFQDGIYIINKDGKEMK